MGGGKIASQVILSGATATGAAPESFPPWKSLKTFHGWGTTASGAGAATIDIEASNDDGASWVVIGTLTLVLATTLAAGTADGGENRYPWKKVRANVTTISGTGASVSVTMATEGV